MFCPQCGTDSVEGQHYCRSCGTNLKVVGRAVTLGDAISKTDGMPAKVKEIMSNIKIAHVTDEVSRAMEKMNAEIARSSAKERFRRRIRKEKTAEERRERHLTRGTIKFFWGTGLSIFLYFLSHGIVLKLDPAVINKVPFDIESVVRLIWIIGLVPVLRVALTQLQGLLGNGAFLYRECLGFSGFSENVQETGNGGTTDRRHPDRGPG